MSTAVGVRQTSPRTGLGIERLSTVNGHNSAYRIIDRTSGNANDWFVVEWSTARPSLIPVWAGVASTAVGVLLIAIALLMLRHQQSTLRQAARLDHLTGLANRKALEEALKVALNGAHSRRDSIAVLMLDLNGFKQVNDTLGHDKGDPVRRPPPPHHPDTAHVHFDLDGVPSLPGRVERGV